MNKDIKLLDDVALLKDIPERNLVAGQVGTIMEKLDENVYEVEFCNSRGETIEMAAVEAKDLLILHFER